MPETEETKINDAILTSIFTPELLIHLWLRDPVPGVELAGLSDLVATAAIIKIAAHFAHGQGIVKAATDHLQNEFGLSVQKLFNQPEALMADLLPVRWSNFNQPIDYCNLQDIAGKLTLVVRVMNQGNADAPASTTSVAFGGGGGTVAVPTPPIPAGQFVDVNVLVPAVGSTDIFFTITVDAQNNVTESDKSNNVADGTCIG
jgi:hypothetical protein